MLYICAALLTFENGLFIYLKEFQLQWVTIIPFVGTLFLWMFISSKWIFMRHGENVVKCKVMIFLTNSYITKLKNKKSLILR